MAVLLSMISTVGAALPPRSRPESDDVRTTYRLSPGTRAPRDILAMVLGRTPSRCWPGETPVLDCLQGGATLAAFWRDLDSGGGWQQGYLDLRHSGDEVRFDLRRGIVRPGATVLTWEDDPRLAVAETRIRLGLRSPDPVRFRAVELRACERRLQLAVPRTDYPLLASMLRARADDV